MKKKFLYLFTHFQFQFFAILLIAILFRICFLSSGVLLGDEPLYSVRSIGFVDSFASDLQTTPFDWFPMDSPGGELFPFMTIHRFSLLYKIFFSEIWVIQFFYHAYLLHFLELDLSL